MCRVDLALHVPGGWSLSLFTLDSRGYVRLEGNSKGLQTTKYGFAGSVHDIEIEKFEIKGPYDNDYFNRTTIPIETLNWSSCDGETRDLRIHMRAMVKGVGMMTVDSSDGEFKQSYGIAWRRCAPLPPPNPERGSDIVSLKSPGNGFDGDLELCLNYRTGEITTSQIGGGRWRGMVNLLFELKTASGAVSRVPHLVQVPSRLPLPGDWSRVQSARPVVTSWSRAGRGNPPEIRPYSNGTKSCLRLIDGDGGRPGPVNLAVDWNILR